MTQSITKMGYKFHIGQLVEFWPKKGSPVSSARGAYEIIRQMPERDGELQYRIKSAVEGHDRVALESELSGLGPGNRAGPLPGSPVMATR
jgi:hypothetical protein